jgi:hypothetical protein
VKVDRAAAGMLGMPAAAADAPGTTAARIQPPPRSRRRHSVPD